MTAGSRSKTPFPFQALARFADNLYRARELSGLDQKEAAKRAALTRDKLDKIEGGEYIPSLDILIRLAGTYSTSVGDLVNGVTWRPGWVENSGPAEYLVADDEPQRPDQESVAPNLQFGDVTLTFTQKENSRSQGTG